MITTDAATVGPWVCERTGGTFEPNTSTAIGWEEDGELRAGVLYDQYNGRSICMHVASDGSRRWMTREYLGVCFDYPFHQLGVNRIIGLVDSTNQQALRFDLALGFKIECEIEDAGKTGSLVILSMSKDSCRWLKLGARYGWKVRRACTA